MGLCAGVHGRWQRDLHRYLPPFSSYLSHGSSVRKSMTSHCTPCLSAASAAAPSNTPTCAPHATSVMSDPGRTSLACPNGTTYASSGTCSAAVRYKSLGTKNTNGLASAAAASSRPLALAGPLGTTTLSPGTCVKNASGLCEW